jgi:hypothetical protein
VSVVGQHQGADIVWRHRQLAQFRLGEDTLAAAVLLGLGGPCNRIGFKQSLGDAPNSGRRQSSSEISCLETWADAICTSERFGTMAGTIYPQTCLY